MSQLPRHIRRAVRRVSTFVARIHRFVRRTRIDAPASAVFAYHLRSGAFERLLPPADGTRVLARTGAIERDDMRVELSVPVLGPVRQRWVVRHEGYEPGRRFVDVIERGPFRHWRHEHLVEPLGDGACELVDTIVYALPGGPIGARVGVPITRSRLEPMFEHRHRITHDDVRAIAASPLEPCSLRVEAAATSTAATQLVAFLLLAGHDVASTSIEILGLDMHPGAGTPTALLQVGPEPGCEITISVPGRQAVSVDGTDPTTAPRHALETLARELQAATSAP